MKIHSGIDEEPKFENRKANGDHALPTLWRYSLSKPRRLTHGAGTALKYLAA
jgi:hypothetical protein